MTDNDRKRVNELYHEIVYKHDPNYCDPEPLPIPAVCALIKEKVNSLAASNNSCNAEMIMMKRELDKTRDIIEPLSKFRRRVYKLLELEGRWSDEEILKRLKEVLEKNKEEDHDL